jgi:hypothetical protein
MYQLLDEEYENFISYIEDACSLCPLGTISDGETSCSSHYHNISRAFQRIFEMEEKWERISDHAKIARKFMSVFSKESRLLLQEIQRVEANKSAIWHQDDPVQWFRKNLERNKS